MDININDLPLPVKDEGFTWCLVAPRGAGKSTLTAAALHKYIDEGVFAEKNIHIFCPTLDLNDDYKDFEEANQYSKVNPRDIQQLVDEAEKIIKVHGRKKMPQVLVVLDDCLAENGLITNKGTALEKLFVRGRHLQISVILISQQLHRINNTLRKNTGRWTMFRPWDLDEVENFLKKLVLAKHRSTFLDRFMEVWEQPYQFVTIDFTTHNYSRQFRVGLSEPMFEKKNLKSMVIQNEEN
jgi:ABC-type cobalamin transport system ATPase subunit